MSKRDIQASESLGPSDVYSHLTATTYHLLTYSYIDTLDNHPSTTSSPSPRSLTDSHICSLRCSEKALPARCSRRALLFIFPINGQIIIKSSNVFLSGSAISPVACLSKGPCHLSAGQSNSAACGAFGHSGSCVVTIVHVDTVRQHFQIPGLQQPTALGLITLSDLTRTSRRSKTSQHRSHTSYLESKGHDHLGP